MNYTLHLTLVWNFHSRQLCSSFLLKFLKNHVGEEQLYTSESCLSPQLTHLRWWNGFPLQMQRPKCFSSCQLMRSQYDFDSFFYLFTTKSRVETPGGSRLLSQFVVRLAKHCSSLTIAPRGDRCEWIVLLQTEMGMLCQFFYFNPNN